MSAVEGEADSHTSWLDLRILTQIGSRGGYVVLRTGHRSDGADTQSPGVTTAKTEGAGPSHRAVLLLQPLSSSTSVEISISGRLRGSEAAAPTIPCAWP